MRTYLMKRIQIENSEELKISSHQEHLRAKEVLEKAKSLNRPIKYLSKGVSMEWKKEKKKIERKKY